MSTFNELIYNHNILKALQQIGYETPTPIQEKAIPIIRAGKDMIALSNTGTGKTAAFGLPLLEHIEIHPNTLSLIICPTRELALQAHDEIRRFSRYMKPVHAVCVYGGSSIQTQIKQLKQKPQIIIGTPGRMLDHIRRKTIRLANCECVVLDEADEMLNMGFKEDIESILQEIKTDHQTLLFSATMPKEIRNIAQTFLHDPQEIRIQSKQKTVDTITQYYYDVKMSEKNDALQKVLSYYNSDMTIVFCNTKARVDDVVECLKKDGIMAMALHGDIRQEKRTKIMQTFKNAKHAVLVASDVAARGIDVSNIDLVVNYDLPMEKELYVHRIGRTGRAGKDGLAITFLQNRKQMQQLQQLMRYTKANIEKRHLPSEAEISIQKKETLKKKILLKAQNGICFANMQLANECIKEGLSVEEIISALISVANQGDLILTPKERKKEPQNTIDLKFSVGKAKNITREDIEKAILGNCRVKKTVIARIDVRRQYSIVSVDKKYAEQILSDMDRTKIQNKRCDVYLYKKEKNKKTYR